MRELLYVGFLGALCGLSILSLVFSQVSSPNYRSTRILSVSMGLACLFMAVLGRKNVHKRDRPMLLLVLCVAIVGIGSSLLYGIPPRQT